MSEHNKKKLDGIQTKALRIASGAICGTANSAIYRSTWANHHCSLDAYSNSFSMQPKLKPHTITQPEKFLKNIGQLGGGNIMKIRLQYNSKVHDFFVLRNELTWEAPRYPSELDMCRYISRISRSTISAYFGVSPYRDIC